MHKERAVKIIRNKKFYIPTAALVILFCILAFTRSTTEFQASYHFSGMITDNQNQPVYGAYVFTYLDEDPKKNPELLKRSADCIKKLSQISTINDGQCYGVTKHDGRFLVSITKNYSVTKPAIFGFLYSEKSPFKTVYLAVFKYGLKTKFLQFKTKELKEHSSLSNPNPVPTIILPR